MTEDEAIDLATQLLLANGNSAFDVSMPDQQDYDLMRTTFDRLGHPTGPDGDFFVVRVFARPTTTN